MTGIESVDQALRVMAGLAGWDTPADSADPFVINLCYVTARDRTEELSPSRARLEQARAVVETCTPVRLNGGAR